MGLPSSAVQNHVREENPQTLAAAGGRSSSCPGTWLGKYLELPQVPDLEGPIIPATEQEGLPAAPADDVDVPIVGSGGGEHAGLAGGSPDVPDANGGIS